VTITKKQELVTYSLLQSKELEKIHNLLTGAGFHPTPHKPPKYRNMTKDKA